MASQKLLISVRGPKEAVSAAQGGAHIVDVEYPVSALGTPYPLNILAVKESLIREGYDKVELSTNIGEIQASRASSCQAALGVATSGAGLVKFGLANLSPKPAIYLGSSLVRTVRHWYPDVKCYPAVFVDEDQQRFFNPFDDGCELAKQTGSNGLLIDTFNKSLGKGLLDYCTIEELAHLVNLLHSTELEAWIAGSITKTELPSLWEIGVDVICVRGDACEPGTGSERFGQVTASRVRELYGTIPST